MIKTDVHQQKLSDDQTEKIGTEFNKRRGVHLKKLEPLEELCRLLAPLPMSYDVMRLQPPYFNEFTYSEMLGCLYVSPQSSEVSARLCVEALDDDYQYDFDVAAALLKRGAIDKYQLDATEPTFERVVFLPGSNMYHDAISKENLHRLMFDSTDVAIKPHPMTNPDHQRYLGIHFGYHRVLDPKSSGLAHLNAAQEVFVAATTEMGLYAVLMEKRVRNITSFNYESRAVFNSFYRLLWNKPLDEAKQILCKLLNSPISGFFHPDDPQLEEKIKRYFETAMQWRDAYRPLVNELGPTDWTTAVVNRGRPKGDQNAVRKG
jgi:hypothetical protein